MIAVEVSPVVRYKNHTNSDAKMKNSRVNEKNFRAFDIERHSNKSRIVNSVVCSAHNYRTSPGARHLL